MQAPRLPVARTPVLRLGYAEIDPCGAFAVKVAQLVQQVEGGLLGGDGFVEAPYLQSRAVPRLVHADTSEWRSSSSCQMRRLCWWSRAGRRGIVLPAQLAVVLEQHRGAQDVERKHAGSLWEDGDWMFAQENGRPVDPTMDRNEWTRLLSEAGARPARIHDARHTAATVLLLLGVPERAAMEFMGWSIGAMAMRYQHVTAVLRQDIANRLDGFLWGPTETGS